MYIIAEHKGGYQAIRVCKTENRPTYKMRVGRTERRIILQVGGRKYVAYSTEPIRAQYPGIGTDQLDDLRDEIMEELHHQMLRRVDYVDIPKISGIAEMHSVRRWMATGQLLITSLEAYYGHPIDPTARQLDAYVCVDVPILILMDHEPPADIAQEELPY